MQWQHGASRLCSYYLLSSNIHSPLLPSKNFQVLFGHKAMQNKDHISQPPLYLGVVTWSSFIQWSIGKTLVCDILKVKLVSDSFDPTDCTVHGILQARILEWIAFPFSRGIFPTQGWNPGLPHCRRILYQLSQKGSPRILEWVAYPFSRGSSWPRNQTGVCCIAGGFFTNWAIRETLCDTLVVYFKKGYTLLCPSLFPKTGILMHVQNLSSYLGPWTGSQVLRIQNYETEGTWTPGDHGTTIQSWNLWRLCLLF